MIYCAITGDVEWRSGTTTNLRSVPGEGTILLNLELGARNQEPDVRRPFRALGFGGELTQGYTLLRPALSSYAASRLLNLEL